jgi:hypothetical protein
MIAAETKSQEILPVEAGSISDARRRESSSTGVDINRYMIDIDMATRKLYNFYIDPNLAAGLKVVKARDGVPEAESIRRALAEYLEKKGAMKAERQRAVTRKRPDLTTVRMTAGRAAAILADPAVPAPTRVRKRR